MRLNYKTIVSIILLILLLLGLLVYISPWLVHKIALWQKEFNQLISGYLHQIKQRPIMAGMGLVLVSFIYGVLHALGPGHGKFIIAGYLSLHQTQIKTAVRLTLLAALVQGLVAIILTSLVVVLLNLSSRYFKLSQLWLERGAILLLILLALYWFSQGLNNLLYKWWRSYHIVQPVQRSFNIKTIKPMPQDIKIKSAVQNPIIFSNSHFSAAHCDCGHQHMPSHHQLNQATSWKSQLLVIFSIGMRPCTGAIFVLFLSYMLDLYLWGIVASLAMALGTGLTLSAFALLLQYAKQWLLNLGKWYFSPNFSQKFVGMGKLIAGLILLLFALGLWYSTMLPSSGGAVLLGR